MRWIHVHSLVRKEGMGQSNLKKGRRLVEIRYHVSTRIHHVKLLYTLFRCLASDNVQIVSLAPMSTGSMAMFIVWCGKPMRSCNIEKCQFLLLSECNVVHP